MAAPIPRNLDSRPNLGHWHDVKCVVQQADKYAEVGGTTGEVREAVSSGLVVLQCWKFRRFDLEFVEIVWPAFHQQVAPINVHAGSGYHEALFEKLGFN